MLKSQWFLTPLFFIIIRMNETESSSIITIVLCVLSFAGTAVFWEFVAWWMHKYVMHGIGWFLHRDHHVTSGRRLQKNDLYSLFFALCSFLLIYNGLRLNRLPVAMSGFGVALYGVGYVLFHDLLFHRRIKRIRIRTNNAYLKRIVSNHRKHHGTVTRRGASHFSFLWALGTSD